MKLNRFMFTKRKITRTDLVNFTRRFKVRGKVLIVYIEVDPRQLFDDYDILPDTKKDPDRYYELLEAIESDSYHGVVCMGLLEHMRDPARLVAECHRIVQPGGKVFVSASSVFSVHCGPHDYFHITQFGARVLFEKHEWQDLDIRSSCGPFRTLGINCQRILLQSEMVFFIRPFVEALAWLLPLLDVFVIRQYSERKAAPEYRIDSMLPSNIQIIATK